MAARRVTVKDVAKRAGVSQATVSYVLNENSGQTITPATQLRVRDAVRELGYTPSRAARVLRSGRSDLVLLLLPDAPIGENLARMMERFTDAMDTHGYLAVTRRKRRGQPMGHLVAEIAPAAVFCMGPVGPEDAPWVDDLSLPVVCLGADTGRWTTDPLSESRSGESRSAETLSGEAHSGDQPHHLDLDDVSVLQVEHLVAAGHRRLGIARPRSPELAMYAGPRSDRVRRACAERDLPEPLEIMLDLNPEDAIAAVTEWREAGVTAVAAYNDEYAIAVLAGLRLSGLAAPADLAVVGVDDIPLAALTNPPLTSVSLDLKAAVDHAAASVLRALGADPDAPAAAGPPLRVVARESA